MYTIKKHGEKVDKHRNWEKAHNIANDIARDMFEYGHVTVEDYKGVELVDIFCDGWNVYTHYSFRR